MSQCHEYIAAKRIIPLLWKMSQYLILYATHRTNHKTLSLIFPLLIIISIVLTEYRGLSARAFIIDPQSHMQTGDARFRVIYEISLYKLWSLSLIIKSSLPHHILSCFHASNRQCVPAMPSATQTDFRQTTLPSYSSRAEVRRHTPEWEKSQLHFKSSASLYLTNSRETRPTNSTNTKSKGYQY